MLETAPPINDQDRVTEHMPAGSSAESQRVFDRVTNHLLQMDQARARGDLNTLNSLQAAIAQDKEFTSFINQYSTGKPKEQDGTNFFKKAYNLQSETVTPADSTSKDLPATEALETPDASSETLVKPVAASETATPATPVVEPLENNAALTAPENTNLLQGAENLQPVTTAINELDTHLKQMWQMIHGENASTHRLLENEVLEKTVKENTRQLVDGVQPGMNLEQIQDVVKKFNILFQGLDDIVKRRLNALRNYFDNDLPDPIRTQLAAFRNAKESVDNMNKYLQMQLTNSNESPNAT